MNRLWTAGTLALCAVEAIGCGNSSPTQPKVVRALLTLSIPPQVVAVPADPPYGTEVTIPLVVRESAGVTAYIYALSVKTTDEASGAVSSPPVVRVNPTGTIPAGSSVEIPLRVSLPGSGAYRAKVVLDASDAGGPAGTVATGAIPADGSGINMNVAERTTFESSEFRILPPQ